MKLPLAAALTLYPTLPSDIRAGVSRIAFADAAHVAHYVRAACQIAADKGLHVDAEGHVGTGDSGVTPDESAKRFAKAAGADPSLMRDADSAIKGVLDRDQRMAAVVHAVYDAGLALDADGHIAE